MAYLNAVFDLILAFLTNLIYDDTLGTIVWVFLLVIVLLLFIKLMRMVKLT